MRHRGLIVLATSLSLSLAGILAPAATTTGDRAEAAAATALRVGSFNIGGVQTDKSARGSHRTWAVRRDGVVNRIHDSRLDVIGLQEANPSTVHRRKLVTGSTQYDDVLNGLRRTGVNYRLTTAEAYNCERAWSGTNCDYRNRGSALSNRIVYNADRLSVVRKGSVKYRDQTRGGYDRYLEWAVFRIKATGSQFLFTNTHLDPNSKANRPKQWRQLLEWVGANRGRLPVISVGDYNTTKFSTWAKRTLPLTRKFGMSDALNQRFQQNPGKPRAKRVVNGWLNSFSGYRKDVRTWSYYRDKRKQGNVIDWIFAGNKLTITEYATVAWIDKRRLRGKGTFPSDHNLVRATILIP